MQELKQLSIFFSFNPKIVWILFYIFCVYVLYISIIDLKEKEMSIYLFLIPGIVILLYLFSQFDYLAIFHTSVLFLSLFVSYFIAKKLFGRPAFGGADIALLSIISLLWGWKVSILSLYIGTCVAGIVCMVLLGIKKIKIGDEIPFCPFISIGWVLSLLITIYTKSIFLEL